jgi:GntR family transcriptional repressor for pyruvate dehydrogenase complex
MKKVKPSAPPALRPVELERIVRPLRLSEEVSGALQRRIAGGELKPGDRLPTEKALGDVFGVSRAVVREAVARLKADGLIESRQGSGAFVVDAPKSINLRFWQGENPAKTELRDIFELRAMVEGAVAELAAQRRDTNDLRIMKTHLLAMDEAITQGIDGTEIDDNFHIAMARATHNPFVTKLVEFLGRHFSQSRKLSWDVSPATKKFPREVQREHHALFEAITAADPHAARCQALEHLHGAARRASITLPTDLEHKKRT